MAVFNQGVEALAQALLDQEFRAVDEFDSFVTFVREGDPLKSHVGQDGSFAGLKRDDEIVAEGAGSDDLYRVLVTKTPVIRSRSLRHARRRLRTA
jgi:hypothetical protein